MNENSFIVRYKGQEFVLSLRTTEDGYISAWEYGAMTRYMNGFVTREYKVVEDFYADEYAVNRFMSLVLEQGTTGTVRINGSDVRFPFKSWSDLPYQTLKEIVDRFFTLCLPKIQNYGSSISSIGVPLKTLVSFLLETVTRGQSLQQPQQDQ